MSQLRLINFLEMPSLNSLRYQMAAPLVRPEGMPLGEQEGIDWGLRFERVKHSANYTCSRCFVRLQGQGREYLYVHHANGDTSDLSESNLVVLCVRCYATEPMHAHVKDYLSYTNFVAQHP